MPDREKYIEVLSKAVKAVKELNEDAPIKISLECIEDILKLLKEQEAVKPKTGHWFKIHGGTAAQCTICKCWGQINMKFCPWCGTKMET